MKSEIAEKRKKTFEKKNETPRAVLNTARTQQKERNKNLSSSLSLSLVVVGRE